MQKNAYQGVFSNYKPASKEGWQFLTRTIMQNALYYQIVCWGMCSLIFSCQASTNKAEQLSLEEVEIEDQNGWVLTVAADGSGSLYCTALRHQVVQWPSGTFPFEQVHLLPRFEPQVQDRYPFRWTYRRSPEAEVRQYSLPDTSWAVRWFKLAHEALLHSHKSSAAHRQLRRQWELEPPIGVESN